MARSPSPHILTPGEVNAVYASEANEYKRVLFLAQLSSVISAIFMTLTYWFYIQSSDGGKKGVSLSYFSVMRGSGKATGAFIGATGDLVSFAGLAVTVVLCLLLACVIFPKKYDRPVFALSYLLAASQTVSVTVILVMMWQIMEKFYSRGGYNVTLSPFAAVVFSVLSLILTIIAHKKYREFYY